MDRNNYQQSQTGKCGDVGDEGSHLIASSLGGAGDKINIVQQYKTVCNDPRAMEKYLGLPVNSLNTGALVRVDFEKPSLHGLRMPSGREAGAND